MSRPSPAPEPVIVADPRPGPSPASKLQIPWARPGLVERRTLVERLCSSPARIIEVVAPAGYGKTTVLSQWAVRAPLPVAWLTVDDDDNDPARLLADLAEALGSIRAIDPSIARAFSAPAAQPIGGVAELLRAMGGEPFVLVIDNAEVITNAAAGHLVAALVRHLPPAARLAIASRSAPPLPTARLRASGEILEIRAGDLAMSSEEAATLLAAAGFAVGGIQLDELVGQTEGWPAGLYLAALAHRDEKMPTVGGVGIRGDDRLVADYLRSEVLAHLAPDVLTFVIRSSILDRLCGALCDEMLERTGSAVMLEDLEASNLLLVPLDRRREWYRWHHLLRDLLRSELERHDPDEVPALHRRAAAWLEEHGQPEEAVRHAQAGGDHDRAARLVLQWGPLAYRLGRITTFRSWLEWFDVNDVVRQHPEVAAVRAISEALLGEPVAAMRWADLAESAGEPVHDDTLSGLRSLMAAIVCRHGVGQMRLDAERAAASLDVDHPLAAAAFVFLGIACQLTGDDDAAERAHLLAIDLGRALPVAASAPMAMAELGVMAIARRDWAAAEDHARSALHALPGEDIDGLVNGVIIHSLAARVAAHRGDVAGGRRHLTRAARLRSLCTWGLPESTQFLVQLARAHLELGDPPGARSVLRQARDILGLRPDLGLAAADVAELAAQVGAASAGSNGGSALTTAELRLMPLLATHLSFPQIGEQLYLSRHTVKTQAMSIYRKLGASSRREAVERLQEAGLLGP